MTSESSSSTNSIQHLNGGVEKKQPHLLQHPERVLSDTVLFDGHCQFCRSQIENLKRLDRAKKLNFLSLHDGMVEKICPDLSHEDLMREMWIVTTDGKKFGGADAIRYLSSKLLLMWPLAPLLHIPFTMPLWRYLYRLIARNRYRIAGKSCDSESCSLHR